MSILIKAENIPQNNQKNIDVNEQVPLNDEETSILKQKMKQLQQEIQVLQKLKLSKNYSQRKQPTQKISQSIQNQKPQTQKQQGYESASILSQNLKNSKITDLVSQLNLKDQFPTKRKRSWSRTIPPQSQRNSVRNLKQTLQKIDISEQKKKKRIAAKIFNQKQQNNNVQSNIFNVTIAQIIAGQITKKQEEKVRMLSQIVDLKSKIKELTIQKQNKEKKIQQQVYQSPIQQITARLPVKTSQFNLYQQQKTERVGSKINGWSFADSQQNRIKISIKKTPQRTQQNQFIETNRFNENTFRSEISGTGKIYSRSRILRPRNHGDEDYQSITTLDYQLQNNTGHSIQLRRNSNPFTWNPQITLTLPQQSHQMKMNQIRSGRIYSSIQMQKKQQYSEEKRQQRTKPLFNIMKKKKISVQCKKEEQVTKIIQKQEQTITETKMEDKPLQKPKKKFKRPQERFNQIKIDKMKNEPFPLKDILPNFREYIYEKLISIKLPPTPTLQFGQTELQKLGRRVFELFDIFVDQETQKKGIEYKVTKYKNCVLFRLNEEKNIVWYFDGKFYQGGWEINLIGEGKKQGFGFQIIPNKFIYQGFFKSSKRDGYGIMSLLSQNNSENQIIYEGFWKQGIKDGQGYQIQPLLQYLGDFKMGLQTGKCKIKTEQTLYQGQIRDSVKIGKGHEILRNGDQYYGDFDNNTFNGIGQYRWKSGAYFYGSFVNGTRKGEGIWISNIFSNNFDIYKGSYEDNKKNGFGVYQWANGTIYDGYFKNDLRHDEGKMIFPNGKAAKFIWKDGVKTTKLYCQQEQTYRRLRNSPRKFFQGNQTENFDDENEHQQKSFNRSSFSQQVLNELKSHNLSLFPSQKSKEQTINQDNN